MTACSFHSDTFADKWNVVERSHLRDELTKKRYLPESAPFQKLALSSNWSLVALKQRQWDGRQVSKWFIQDNASGDLYLPNPTREVAVKCGGLALGTLFYIPAVILYNAVRIFADVAIIAIRTLKDFGQNWRQRGATEAFVTIFFAVTWEMPVAVFGNICRIAKAPLHGVGMIYAGLYGIFSPYEGRKWFARIESSLHEGMTMRDDLRYHYQIEGTAEEKLSDDINRLMAGNIFFVGYCMQPLGNISDKSSHLNRFEPIA